MDDQKHQWNKLHAEGNIDHYSNKPTDFAIEVSKLISQPCKILELGCGVGNGYVFI